MGKSKYKRVTDLYAEGAVIELQGDEPLWLQVINPLERQEAQTDAQVAKARMTLALRDHASDMHAKARMKFEALTDDEAVELLLEFRAGEAMVKSVEAVKNDEDWADRNAILERSDDILALPIEDPERRLLEQVNREYILRINELVREELDYLRDDLAGMTAEQRFDDYLERSIDAQGAKSAMEEYRLTELWLGSRVCEGVKSETDAGVEWDHGLCNGHRERVYDDKAEVRALPDQLYELLDVSMQALQMTVREAKNSDRQRSSSGSFPLPSEVEASTPSTPDETPDAHPGSSSQPLTTPSPS